MGGNCLADTVWLTNGDRISGEIQELNETSLTIKTDYNPSINIKLDAINSLKIAFACDESVKSGEIIKF